MCLKKCFELSFTNLMSIIILNNCTFLIGIKNVMCFFWTYFYLFCQK